MARAATTSDAFNAIAEPQRRNILVLLRAGERPVTDLAQELGMSQPQASKHLRVLREVGLVRVRGAGKQRLYGLDARGLRPVHEWAGGFERFWNESFDRLDAGTRLFDGVDASRIALEPVRSEPSSRVTHLTYAVHPR
ncbi:MULTISPECIES: metalloregulator ArsR/SmtB family transcription factor [unclassified Streptomyces]|uniref:ArsR/SmtB family transcription factor n=1 Tax=unclassified Streptomyces TaxID=2593676 RepID=UPI001EFFD9ED|nr:MULTISPECIES: metalloregulator ArsR/SmtB family transcription factor [unclassified Streptomyces]